MASGIIMRLPWVWLVVWTMVVGPVLLWLTGTLPLTVEGVLFTRGFWRPPSATDQDLVLVLWWFCHLSTGGLFYWMLLNLTRNASRSKRIVVRSLAIASFATPSIVIAHSPVILPAIVILATTLFVSEYGWVYALLFGALPIGIAWGCIAAAWFSVGAVRQTDGSDAAAGRSDLL